MRVSCTVFALNFCLGFVSVGHAQEVCPNTSDVPDSEDVFVAFDMLRADKDLGAENCTTSLCRRINQWVDRPAGDAKVEASAELLDAIRIAAADLSPDIPEVVNVQRRFVEWQLMLLTNEDVALLPTVVWKPAQMVLFSGHPDEVDFEEVLARECGEEGTVGDCRSAFNTAACTYSLAVMQRRVLFGLLEEERRATIDYLDLLNSRWAAFNTGGRSLYPWELALNGWLYERDHGARGFVEPPRRQFVIAHPSIAVEYANAESGGMEEALVLELLGWYRWRWADNSADMKRPFGASLIATWTGEGDAGYGVMFHLPRNWSIGVTQREVLGEDETTVLLSFDLGRLIAKENALRTGLLDEVKAAIR